MKALIGGFVFLFAACSNSTPYRGSITSSASEISEIEIATADWARTLKKHGKDWFVYQDAQQIGPAKASLALRTLEVLSRDRTQLPMIPNTLPCPSVLLLKSAGTGPNFGLTVCKSDRDFYVSRLDANGKPASERSPAVRDGTPILVSALTSPEDLVEKRLVSWNADRVKQIEVRAQGKVTLLERHGVLWTSPAAREILKATLTEPARPESLRSGPKIELTIRGLNEDPIVIHGSGNTFAVSNRPGVYKTTLSVTALAQALQKPVPNFGSP